MDKKRGLEQADHDLKPLRQTPTASLIVEIIHNERGRFLDIREHLKTRRYSGPTERGIRLSSVEWHRLLAQSDEITKLLG